MAVKCLKCAKTVRKNQHAIECDECHCWTHRTCDTGVSKSDYLRLVESGDDFPFTCYRCSNSSIQVEVGRFSITLESVDEIDTSNLHAECGGVEDVIEFTERSMELSINEDAFDSEDDTPVQFTVLKTGSQKGKPLLMESSGYTYVVKSSRGQKTYWRCSQRGKKLNCTASVTQTGDNFTKGPSLHSHPLEPGKLQEAKIKMMVKESALTNIQESGRSIAERVTDEVAADEPHPGGLTDPDLLARIANRCREKIRPKDPKDLEFEIAEDFLPDHFLCGDIAVKGERHLLFASERQLSLLSAAQHWFVDGTFKIVKDPFYQLMSVHAFLKVGKQMKMMPLLRLCQGEGRWITSRSYVSYWKLCQTPPAVKAVTMDYESATWMAFKHVLPRVNIQGCVFHFTQAVCPC